MSDAPAPLRDQVARAAGWNAAIGGLTRLLSTVRIAILAHLLPPAAFGVFAIALIAAETFDAITTSGFDSALVRKSGDIKAYLDTAWTVQVVRGVGVAGLLYLASGSVAGFFREPSAIVVLQLMSIAPLIRGLENIGTISFRRDLNFRLQFLWTAGELLVDLTIATIVAYVWRTPFALVGGFLAGRFARTVLSYYISPFRPRLTVDWQKAREMHQFGRWISLNNILFLIALRGDKAVVGRVLGTTALGVYELAFRACEMVTGAVASVIGTVALPAYARVQDDLVRLRRGYLVILEQVAAIVLPVAVLLTVFPSELIRVFFGERWLIAAAIVPLLAWQAVIRAIAATAGPVFLAIGKPTSDFGMSAARVAIMCFLIVPLSRQWGLRGAAAAVLASSVGIIPFYFFFLQRDLQLSGRSLLRALAPGSVLAAGTAAAPLFVLFFSEGGGRWTIVALVAAGASYALLAFGLMRARNTGPAYLLSNLIAGKRPLFLG